MLISLHFSTGSTSDLRTCLTVDWNSNPNVWEFAFELLWVSRRIFSRAFLLDCRSEVPSPRIFKSRCILYVKGNILSLLHREFFGFLQSSLWLLVPSLRGSIFVLKEGSRRPIHKSLHSWATEFEVIYVFYLVVVPRDTIGHFILFSHRLCTNVSLIRLAA